MKIAITGASGFIGSRLAQVIVEAGHELASIGREMMEKPQFVDASCVVHCAGLAHGRYSTAQHEQVNNTMTVSLAKAAAAAGVRRFVFLSSINVVAGNPGKLLPTMPYAPVDSLGQAKANAERTLLARGLDMEIVIVRPTLVYGPNVRGNLRSLMRLLDTPFPLPLGENQRSMVSLTNLASALLHLAITRQDIDRRIFHVTDGPASSASIAYWARIGMGRAPRPAAFLARPAEAALKLAGQRKMADQLYGNLLVDASDLLNIGWLPRATMASDLMAMGASWRQSRAK